MAITVSILAPSPLLSHALQHDLHREPDIHTAVVPFEWDLALRQLRTADVALLHHALPEALLFRELRALHALPGSARPMVVDVPDEPALLVRYLELGALGYVLRNEPQVRLIEVVRDAARGEARLDPWLIPRLLERYRQLRHEQL